MSSSRVRHNILYNFLGSVVPIAVTVVTVPIYIRMVGVSRYGILALLWTVFGYFGLFDFGLSRATAHRLATLRDAPLKERTSVFFTACALNLAIGVVVSGIFYAAALPLMSRFLAHSGSLRDEILAALPLIVAFFPLGLIGGVLTGCLEANERFLELNIQQAAGSILWQALPLAAVHLAGPSLPNAVLGAVAARGVSTLWLALTCLRWALPAGAPRLDRRHVEGLLRYGGWTTVTNICGPILTSIDQFIIGALLGAKAVAHYNVPYGVAMKALIPPAAFTRALFPRLAHHSEAEAEKLSRTALLLLSAGMAAACAPAILLANVGLTLWVGADFAKAARLPAELLLFGAWVNGVAFIPFTLLQARNRPEILAKLHALELVPFALLLWFAIKLFGLPGAAAMWAVRVSVDGLLLFRASRLGAGLLLELIVPTATLLLALFVAEWARPGVLLALACSAAVALVPLGWMFLRRAELGEVVPASLRRRGPPAVQAEVPPSADVSPRPRLAGSGRR